MISDHPDRESLFGAIRRSTTPVVPVTSIPTRTVLLAIAGAVAMVAVPLTYELREDAAAIGHLRLWAGSILQLCAAAAVLCSAAAEGTPGSLPSRRTAVLLLAAAAALAVAVDFDTVLISPAVVPADLARLFFTYCYTHVLGLAALLMLPVAATLRRGLFARPALAGLMAGAGAGLMSEAAWRLFCHVSTPQHLLPAHLGATVTMAAIGALAFTWLSRIRLKAW